MTNIVPSESNYRQLKSDLKALRAPITTYGLDLMSENLQLKDRVKMQDEELKRVKAELGRLKDTMSQVLAVRDILAHIEREHQKDG